MELEDLSIRARVALSALCLERLLHEDYTQETFPEGWIIVLNTIWEYTNSSPGLWHYKMSEITPFSVEEDLTFENKGIDNWDSDTYLLIIDAYKDSCQSIKKVVDLIFEIGTVDLYSSIVDNSPRSLVMLNEVVALTKDKGLDVPSKSILSNYKISINEGWGNSFCRSDIVKDGFLSS